MYEYSSTHNQSATSAEVGVHLTIPEALEDQTQGSSYFKGFLLCIEAFEHGEENFH